MQPLTKTEQFKMQVVERIKDGRWGLEQVQHLNDNKLQYHLTNEDIGMFLMHTYNYTYYMAMEDGIMTELEERQLAQIKSYYNYLNPPKNRYEIENIKTKIANLTKKFEKTNAVSEEMDQQARAQEIQQEVKNVYRTPRYTRPKLTPYDNYNW